MIGWRHAVFFSLFHAVLGAPVSSLLSDATTLLPWLQNIRRTLHQIPELKYQEVQTSQYIRERLDELDIKYRCGRSGIHEFIRIVVSVLVRPGAGCWYDQLPSLRLQTLLLPAQSLISTRV